MHHTHHTQQTNTNPRLASVRKPISRSVALAIIATNLICGSAIAANWSLVPQVGVSILGDQSAMSMSLGGEDPAIDLAMDTGFIGGLSVRYDYDSPWTSEFGWEYRSNDSDVTTSNGQTLSGGNYASNIFYLNGRYDLARSDSAWTPFVGAGLTYVEEIDIDVGSGSNERSFSDKGSIGVQFIAGVNKELTERLYLSSEIRYSYLGDLELKEESGDGRVDGLDYDPVTVQLGLGFRF